MYDPIRLDFASILQGMPPRQALLRSTKNDSLVAGILPQPSLLSPGCGDRACHLHHSQLEYVYFEFALVKNQYKIIRVFKLLAYTMHCSVHIAQVLYIAAKNSTKMAGLRARIMIPALKPENLFWPEKGLSAQN